MKSFTHIVFDHDGTLIDMRTLEKKSFEGIKELLEILRSKKVQMFVWTARSRESAQTILKKNAIDHYFSGVCGGYDAPSKPSPAGIEHLVDAANPQNVVVIGDSIGDIIGGQKFGATTIGAMWGHGSDEAYETFQSYGAFDSFKTVEDLKDFLVKNI